MNNISNINSGGCAIAALAMYRWLKKKGQIKKKTDFHFCYHHKDENTLKKNKNNLKRNNNLLSCTHAFIYFKGEYMDSESIINVEAGYNYDDYTFINKKNIIKIYDENLILDSINSGGWNSSFERQRNVKKIAKKLDINLSDVIVR